ncbi:hypothetical protein C8Q75DRAFT_249752 [Abortiporus biennis]|nr:hypothetical protein C8Q75DRAFT_249752 [Abortiporus biennis]
MQRSSFIEQSSLVLRRFVVFVLIAPLAQQTFKVAIASSSLFALGAPVQDDDSSSIEGSPIPISSTSFGRRSPQLRGIIYNAGNGARKAVVGGVAHAAAGLA